MDSEVEKASQPRAAASSAVRASRCPMQRLLEPRRRVVGRVLQHLHPGLGSHVAGAGQTPAPLKERVDVGIEEEADDFDASTAPERDGGGGTGAATGMQ